MAQANRTDHPMTDGHSLQQTTATYRDVQQALSKQTDTILAQIPLSQVLLYQPVDGQGARICVSVEPGKTSEVPNSVQVKLGRRNVTIPIEVNDDYEPIRAL